MARSLLALAAVLLVGSAPLRPAERHLVVIANADSGVSQLTQDEARNLFLGRQKRLSSGLAALPVEQGVPPEIRSRFYHLLAHKDLAEINAYWARLFFTGQAHPPREVSSAEEVVRAVTANRNAIGLVEWGRTDSRVRVVLDVDDPDAH